MQRKRVRGQTPEERRAARQKFKIERRADFYKRRIAKFPAGSFERLRQVLDYVKAVAEDLSAEDREELTGYIARLADERNKP